MTRITRRKRVGDLGAKEDNLRGIVHPYKQRHDGCCGAAGRFQSLRANVQTDAKLASVEQEAVKKPPTRRTSRKSRRQGTSGTA